MAVPILRTALLCLNLAVCAPLAAAEEPRAADHEALRALRAKVTAAINSQDMQTLAGCMAKDFTFTTVDQKRSTTMDEVKAVYHAFFHGPNAFIASHKTTPESDALTKFIGDNVGIATGTAKENYVLKSGKKVDWTVRWTATVVKEADGWKVAAAHVGLDPLDNPILAAAIGFWKLACAGAGLGGLLVGFLLARLLRRPA